MDISDHKELSNEIYKLHQYHRHLLKDFKEKKIKNERKYKYDCIPHILSDRIFWRNGLIIDGKKEKTKLNIFIYMTNCMQDIICRDYPRQGEECHTENGNFILYYQDMYVFGKKHLKKYNFPPIFSKYKHLTNEDKHVIKAFLSDLIALAEKVLVHRKYGSESIVREVKKMKRNLKKII